MLTHPGGPGIIQYKAKNGETKIVETRDGFLKKKKAYQQCVKNSPLSISQFMVRFLNSYLFNAKRIQGCLFHYEFLALQFQLLGCNVRGLVHFIELSSTVLNSKEVY